ncbi:Anaphasehypothetical proteinpromoting complex subunit 11 [Bipolaris maydis]|nr:Anaphasehypothetical proteinpromoting complex subunit 11 [Bipolaris maydis]
MLTYTTSFNAVTWTKTETMKVTIREWNAVAAWHWDMPDDDVCGICRNPYDSTCSKCKFPGDECPLPNDNQALYLRLVKAGELFGEVSYVPPAIQVEESRRANRHRDAQADTGTGYKSPVIFNLACYR